MKIAIFGLGYVGATNAACLAKLGHSIVGIDVNEEKVALLASGRSPIVEPQVPELIAEYFAQGRITATGSVSQGLADADLAMVCVGTPSQPNGAIEAKFLRRVTEQIAIERRRMARAISVVVRSTCLPTVHFELMDILKSHIGDNQPVAYCVHPEFLREGQAVADFFDPPKTIFGPSDDTALSATSGLYPGIEGPTAIMAPAEAALVKYADNCFHAVKVTFGNEIGAIAASFGVDARKVMRAFCLDTKLNISSRYLTPGLPFGGSCLPKDLRAVTAWSDDHVIAIPMLQNVLESNREQIASIVGRIMNHKPRRVALLGLAFKDDTDDLRESPMVMMFSDLRKRGVDVGVFDPLIDRGTPGLPSNLSDDLRSRMSEDAFDLVAKSDIVIIARRKLGFDWTSLPVQPSTIIFDLVGLDLRQDSGKVVGLFW